MRDTSTPYSGLAPHNPEAGFTMIELMIVIAIVAILAMFAAPKYINQTAKAKLTGAVAGAETYKLAVEKCVQDLGVATGCAHGTNEIPATIAAGNAGATIRYVDALTVAAGVITITSTVKNDAGTNMTVIMTPTIGDATIAWTLTGTGCASPTNARGINCTLS